MNKKEQKEAERKEIEERAANSGKTDAIILEVLLDIKDALTK